MVASSGRRDCRPTGHILTTLSLAQFFIVRFASRATDVLPAAHAASRFHRSCPVFLAARLPVVQPGGAPALPSRERCVQVGHGARGPAQGLSAPPSARCPHSPAPSASGPPELAARTHRPVGDGVRVFTPCGAQPKSPRKSEDPTGGWLGANRSHSRQVFVEHLLCARAPPRPKTRW